jgi:hypothetical protein
MYGDKDTYGLGFALAGKAHLYQQARPARGRRRRRCLREPAADDADAVAAAV